MGNSGIVNMFVLTEKGRQYVKDEVFKMIIEQPEAAKALANAIGLDLNKLLSEELTGAQIEADKATKQYEIAHANLAKMQLVRASFDS